MKNVTAICTVPKEEAHATVLYRTRSAVERELEKRDRHAKKRDFAAVAQLLYNQYVMLVYTQSSAKQQVFLPSVALIGCASFTSGHSQRCTHSLAVMRSILASHQTHSVASHSFAVMLTTLTMPCAISFNQNIKPKQHFSRQYLSS